MTASDLVTVASSDDGSVIQADVAACPQWLLDNHERPSLVIADPPYGRILKEKWDVADVDAWLSLVRHLSQFDCPIYWWGGIGKPCHRPFLEFALRVESETDWRVYDWITWRKRRGIGTSKRYLFVREECLLLTVEGRAPKVFHVPYSDELRGYPGYNKKCPAKSPYKRITNVWDDTELLRGKLRPAQKAPAVVRRPIEVHTNPGDLVVDLYACSGETSVQAVLAGRRFVSFERSAEDCALIAERVSTARSGRAA